MIAETIPELENLKPAEKLTLIGELWDQIRERPDEIPTPPEYLDLIEKRLEAHRKNPEELTTWDEIKKRILGDRGN